MALSVARIAGIATTTSGTVTTATASATVAVGACVVVAMMSGNSGAHPATVADSVGNTYTRIGVNGKGTGTNCVLEFFMCASLTAQIVSGSTTISGTITIASSSRQLLAWAITGQVGQIALRALSTYLDNGSTGSGNAITPAIVQAGAGDACIGVVHGTCSGTPTWANDAGWTSDWSSTSGASSTRFAASQYKIASAKGGQAWQLSYDLSASFFLKAGAALSFYDTGDASATWPDILPSTQIDIAYGNNGVDTTKTIEVFRSIPVGTPVIIGITAEQQSATITSLTDSRGNTYTLQGGYTDGVATVGSSVYIYMCASLTTALQPGDVVTATFSTAVDNGAALLVDVRGVKGTLTRRDIQSSVGTGGGASSASASLTTQRHDLLVGMGRMDSASAVLTVDANFDVLFRNQSGNSQPGGARAQGLAVRRQAETVGSFGMSWTGTTTSGWALAAASFYDLGKAAPFAFNLMPSNLLVR